MDEAFVRYAGGDEDVIAIHRFLAVVAAPVLQAAICPKKSIEEVWRVVSDECALMLIHRGVMVGTMGIIRPDWWYAQASFMTDRWHFVLPEYLNTPQAKMLMDEALALADTAGLPFVHQGKLRKAASGRMQMTPRIYRGESATTGNGG